MENNKMSDASFFKHPQFDWQKRYEALRASFLERLPDKVVADRFGYGHGYIRLLKHNFRHGKLDFSEPVTEKNANRRRVSGEVRRLIRLYREASLSAGQIAELLSEEGFELSVRTVERVLAEEGFPKLPRRTRLQIGMTVHGTTVPDRASIINPAEYNDVVFSSSGAGAFLFIPFLAQLRFDQIVKSARLPGSKVIPAMNYLLSFLALKLLGTERYAHSGDHGFDCGLGLFAGLNVLPKCTAMSTYSYALDHEHLSRLQRAFVRQGNRLGLYQRDIVNLDFHTAPHNGDLSVLEKHWAGARGRAMKGALCLFAQDADSKLMLYSASDILRDEMNDQVFEFLSFWKGIQRGVRPTLVFDSRFTTYDRLGELDRRNVRFITLRRRGAKLVSQLEKITEWKRIHISHAKRKYPNVQVNDSMISLRGYEGEIRQIIVRGNGREQPSFLITNDLESPTELIVGNYARRWRVENGIAEAVKFFHLNSLSSPILVKIQFDIIMTMIADTLYSMLAKKLRGFEECNAQTIYRHFVRGKGVVECDGKRITVIYPKRAHNPVLRQVEWDQLPQRIPGMRFPLSLVFK
jgi:transposase